MRVVAAARFEGLLDHDVEHGEALKGVKIVHHHNASHDDAAKADTSTELEQLRASLLQLGEGGYIDRAGVATHVAAAAAAAAA